MADIRILVGDVREKLAELPDNSVHCVVTSPPYFGLRDYGVAGQIGLEPTPAEFVAVMVEVFREVRRVLRKDGTCWLNLGDSYASAWACKRRNVLGNGSPDEDTPRGRTGPGLKEKDLIGIPWRVAFALQTDGWYLRQDIIWSKPNPMPESVTDRCTKAHEYLFLLSRSARYFYDAEAIAEASIEPERAGKLETSFSTSNAACSLRQDVGRAVMRTETRNRRSVWTVATQPFKEAHFATFPPELIEPCIKAGCPRDCCAKCGAPMVRDIEDSPEYAAFKEKERARKGHSGIRSSDLETYGLTGPVGKKSTSAERVTTGWSPSCSCNAGTVRGTVLDPFGGAGTTGLVADRLQRNAILIELNPEYAEIARKRIEGDAPLFSGVGLLAAAD